MPNERTEIINQLIVDNGYKTYLEIGVFDKRNFNAVKCKHKVGVDPDFTCRPDVVMTSDEYFLVNSTGYQKKYDLIFIDGLHHADQVLRDINNALACLSEGGTIVVHDCNPTTEGMQIVPRQQGEWTGDVWKAWQELRFTRVDLEMFVYDVDYGVGIINKRDLDDLGKYSPPSYIGYCDSYQRFDALRKQVLNLIPYGVPLSICIPAFEQYGHGERTLTELLTSLAPQVKSHEVIVSDNGHTLKKIARKFGVTYYHNPDQGISANTNFAISKATHPHIKIMYQDDIALPGCIDAFSRALSQHDFVVANGYAIDEKGRKKRDTNPRWTDQVIKGRNTIGMPSVTGFKRPGFEFDTNLRTMLDCEYYWRLVKEYGEPHIIKGRFVGSRYWHGSTSRKQGNHSEQEFVYLQEKWPELAEHASTT